MQSTEKSKKEDEVQSKHKTLYNYIDKEVFANIRGTSIEERPAAIEDREEYGHWEMDCLVSKQGGSGAALLVLNGNKRLDFMNVSRP